MDRSEAPAGASRPRGTAGGHPGHRASRACRPLAALGRLPLFLLALLPLLVSSCSFNYDSAGLPVTEGEPSAVFRDFDHAVFMDGVRVLSLHASLAESYDATDSIVLHDVSFSSYAKAGGELSAEGHAQTVVFHNATQDAEFSGSIVIHSALEDASLEAEYLEWKGEGKTLEGGLDRSVMVKRGDGSWLRGAGFLADSRRRSFSFREAVEGILVSRDEEAPTVEEAR